MSLSQLSPSCLRDDYFPLAKWSVNKGTPWAWILNHVELKQRVSKPCSNTCGVNPKLNGFKFPWLFTLGALLDQVVALSSQNYTVANICFPVLQPSAIFMELAGFFNLRDYSQASFKAGVAIFIAISKNVHIFLSNSNNDKMCQHNLFCQEKLRIKL